MEALLARLKNIKILASEAIACVAPNSLEDGRRKAGARTKPIDWQRIAARDLGPTGGCHEKRTR